MPSTIAGLPLHPLIVHATVVLVPAAALAVLLAAVWPRFRRWAGWGPLALSVVAVTLTPVTTSSGEALEERVGHSQLIEQHSHLAGMLIWWVVPLAVLAAAQYWLFTFGGGRLGARRNRVVAVVMMLAPVLIGLGTLVQVVLIGHSGAKAAWSHTASAAIRSEPAPSRHG
jgi:uncharacterized membrane protein